MNNRAKQEIKQSHTRRLTIQRHTQTTKSQRKNLISSANHLFIFK